MSHKTRIVLADDDDGIRKELADLLSDNDSIDLVASVPDGNWALDVIEHSNIDVALLDVDMPIMDGVSTAREITKFHPDVKVIVLTAFEHSDSLKRSLEAGAKAFLTKDMPVGRIVTIINKVMAGEKIMDPGPTDVLIRSYLRNEPDPDYALIERIEHLPPRLRNVLDLLVSGKTTQQMGDHLELTERSVRAYVSQLLQATECSNRGELMVRAMRSGYQRSQ